MVVPYTWAPNQSAGTRLGLACPDGAEEGFVLLRTQLSARSSEVPAHYIADFDRRGYMQIASCDWFDVRDPTPLVAVAFAHFAVDSCRIEGRPVNDSHRGDTPTDPGEVNDQLVAGLVSRAPDDLAVGTRFMRVVDHRALEPVFRRTPFRSIVNELQPMLVSRHRAHASRYG